MRSKYIIEPVKFADNSITVDDSNPEGVTLHVIEGNKMASLNCPRKEMIEALEYILSKLKAITNY